MQRKIELILNTYGVSITRKEEGATYRGFFQPVRSKSWQYLEGNFSPLGEVPRGQYVYIGPREQEIAFGETLLVDKKEYRSSSDKLLICIFGRTKGALWQKGQRRLHPCKKTVQAILPG